MKATTRRLTSLRNIKHNPIYRVPYNNRSKNGEAEAGCPSALMVHHSPRTMVPRFSITLSMSPVRFEIPSFR
jgi:hypothetical protein